MMKRILLVGFVTGFVISLSAQNDPVNDVANTVLIQDVEAHLTFLAADEMRGRNTGSPEIDIAANYIASFFKQQGLKTLPGADRYFQSMELQSMKAPKDIEFVVNGQLFKMKDDVALMGGDSVSIAGEIVFAGYGSRDEMMKAKVKDKIVVTYTGNAGENNLAKAFLHDAVVKTELAHELGAKALVEIQALPGIPWLGVAEHLSKERISLKKGFALPHLWMKNSDNAAITALKKTQRASGSLKVRGTNRKEIRAKNVIAMVEGTDAKLKNEFVVISAHYDHVGVNPNSKPDSIFNGARDNAIGTVAMMEAAKFLSKFPPKRSVLFMALTAEEVGMLGSLWYVAHPLVPLNQTVFNFNCDGAGYNDTTMATIIGLERTSFQENLTKACSKFGLKAATDPMPEQNLYERSDNYSFAAKGIPAIDFSPGTKAFDEQLMKYYHQPADEVSTLDFNYLIKFFRSFVYANHLLCNQPQKPVWTAGDKFELESKKLYGK
ncbi:M28 family peptidase [Pseudochryseolinea flava]|nr:M28 family peptidase [Pseudochryseolinea flava]